MSRQQNAAVEHAAFELPCLIDIEAQTNERIGCAGKRLPPSHAGQSAHDWTRADARPGSGNRHAFHSRQPTGPRLIHLADLSVESVVQRTQKRHIGTFKPCSPQGRDGQHSIG